MGDSGSDTETDDEMIKRRQAPRARHANAPVSGAAAHAACAADGRVVASPAASQPPSPGTSSVTSPDRAAPSDGIKEDASPRPRAGFLSLILNNSDDDEPPRFPAPETQPTATTRHPNPSPPAPSDAPRTPSPPPMAVPAPPVPAGATEPDEEHFISPFASLATLSSRAPVPGPASAPVSVPVVAAAPAPVPTTASPHSGSRPAAGPAAAPTTPPASMQAPSSPERPSRPAPVTSATTPEPNEAHSCGLCRERLEFAPARMGMQCNCCMLKLPLDAFSKNQRRPGHPCRRCSSCVKAREMPAKFKNIHGRLNPLEANGPRLTKGQRAKQRANQRAPADQQLSADARWTPAEEHEMEVEVRNFKLAKRSILRRRQSNDLRGSTRVEYIAQLDEEERKLDEKMAKARQKNPALYDEVSQSIKVIRGRVPPEDKDNAGAKKKQKKAASPATAKRKAKATAESDQPDATPSPPAKRARASPPAAPVKKKPAPVKTTKTTPAPSAVSSDDSDYQVPSPPRKVATRAQTRQAAKPVVVIDLIDSDGD